MDIFPRTMFSGVKRSFQKSWYKQFTWLEYSPKEDLAFCFPCRMFSGSTGLNVGQSELTYSKIGFKNWKASTSKFSAHEKSKNHLNSSTSLTSFLNSKPIDEVIDDQRKNINSVKELTRQKNREVMKRLIDITVCLGIGGKPFRGHRESKDDVHKGLFLDIVYLLRKYDPIFNEHFLSGPKNSLYTSNHIQNDLISSINQVIKMQLKDAILNEKVSLIADETSDIGHHEQLSIVIRYFNKHTNCPVEQFICLKRMTAVDAQSIFSSLHDIIQEYGIKWENIVAVCFDGASTMSGCANGVQAKFKQKNVNTFFVHCYGHCLNLVLVDSVGRNNRTTFDFFGNIQLIHNFIESSCIRHAVLEKIANSMNLKLKTLKSVSTTRWACRYEAVSAVKVNYSALLTAINEISESTRQSDIRAKGLGIIYQMKTFEFVFALEMLSPILCSILKVSEYLQKSDINLLTAVQLVESLKNTLETMRNTESNFDNIYKKVIKLCEDNQIVIPPVKKRKVSSKVDCFSSTQNFMDTKEEEMRITVYNVTLDQMINGIDLRFSQETLNMIKSIANALELNVDDNDITILTKTFHLEAEMLKSEISLLQHTDNVPKSTIKNCDTWIKWLTEFNSGRETIFNNIFKMLKIFITIPVTSCSCERAFSKLSLIKTKLRSTMHQDRLDGLLTMSIEQKLAYNLNIDDIIEQFKILSPSERRMVL